MRRVIWIAAALIAGICLLLRAPATRTLGIKAASGQVVVDQTGQPELDRALQAELALYPGAVVLSDPTACNTASDPLGAACIRLRSDEQTALLGIAVFSLEYPIGGSTDASTKQVLGRTADGFWQPWFSTSGPAYYQLLSLPGSLLVCSRGQFADLRAGPRPSAAPVDVLTNGMSLSAERFVLTRPGTFNGPQPPSADVGGYYQISAPEAGWVPSQLVSDAGLGSCSWHDALLTGG